MLVSHFPILFLFNTPDRKDVSYHTRLKRQPDVQTVRPLCVCA